MLRFSSFSACLIICLFFACVPASKKELTVVNMDINNTMIRKMIDFQNLDQVDSLMAFLRHEDPTIRFLAVQSNASLKSKMPIDTLSKMLSDKVMDVRAAAAYALGQYKSKAAVRPLLAAFKNEDTISVNTPLNHNILEAVGKCGDMKMLEFLASTDTYRSSDTLLLLGQMRGLYRYVLRGMTHPNGTAKVVDLLTTPNIDPSIKLVAAHYLSRAQNLDISNYKFQIADVIRQERNTDIRMALCLALKHSDDPEITDFLISQLKSESDYRIKINILKALANRPYNKVVDTYISYLDNENLHLASVAADYLIQNGVKEDASYYRELAKEDMPWLIRSKLLKSVFTSLPGYYANTRSNLRREILSKIESTDNVHESVAYLSALSEDLNAYPALLDLVKESDEQVVRSAAAEAIANIYNHQRYPLNLNRAGPIARSKIKEEIEYFMSTGDEGILYHIASAISNEQNNLALLFDDVQFLNQAKDKLQLPKDVESYNAIMDAIKACKPDTSVRHFVPTAKKQIDWNYLQKHPDSTIAIVKTAKGIIKINLFHEEAPMSVYNFVQLSDQNFYDDKVFHRVVPNFVIQGGCPRGDGFGSSDETIRSEFPQLYYDDAGYIGMASAGPHTESTQWFITHSPTPHLDGRYTIFGKVTEGMDVVHQILPGDKIQDIILTSVL